MQPRKVLMAVTLGSHLMAGVALATNTAQLSITGIPLDQGHHLTKVVIRTWGVEVLAVCHIPKVSVVSVDFDLDHGGVLTWKANSWHGELDQSVLKALSAIFLARVLDYQREPRGNPSGEYHPAPFEGFATITRIEEPRRERLLPLGSKNFSFNPAERCPDPG